jgi:hypothetical protein
LCLKEKIEKHKALAEKAYILEENKNLKNELSKVKCERKLQN